MSFPYSIGVLDNFNRANNANLGSGWTPIAGFGSPLTVETNRARGSTSNFCVEYWNATQFGPDCAAYATFYVYGSLYNYLVLRCDGGSPNVTQYELVISSGTWQIYKRTGGSTTTLGSSASQAVSNADMVGFEAIGTALKGYYSSDGGASWSTIVSTTDSSITAAGYAGFGSYSDGSIWDDFGAGNAGVAAPVADFTATPLSGAAPLSVAFTDTSTGGAGTSWHWEKNNGSGWVDFASTPTAQNPTETFS